MLANIITIIISLCITQAHWLQSLCSYYDTIMFFLLDSVTSVPHSMSDTCKATNKYLMNK